MLFNEHLVLSIYDQVNGNLWHLKNGRWHLYEIDHDETELNDWTKLHPDIVEKMDKMWQGWAKENQVLRSRNLNLFLLEALYILRKKLPSEKTSIF